MRCASSHALAFFIVSQLLMPKIVTVIRAPRDRFHLLCSARLQDFQNLGIDLSIFQSYHRAVTRTDMQSASAGQQAVDQVFRALADPTRRHVLERLSRSPASVSDSA